MTVLEFARPAQTTQEEQVSLQKIRLAAQLLEDCAYEMAGDVDRTTLSRLITTAAELDKMYATEALALKA